MPTESELLAGLELLGLKPEDLRSRERLEPIAMLVAQQVVRALPNDIAVEAVYSASTGRRGVVAGAVDHLLSEGVEPHAAERMAQAAFGPEGVRIFDCHPLLWSWFQSSIGQSPKVPALPWILKNRLAAETMPTIGQTPEGGES